MLPMDPPINKSPVNIQEKKFGSKSRKIIQILTVKEALKNVLLIV